MLQHHYCGKITACHSYGLLGTFFSAINTTDFLLFEALSGVPYGVFSQANDANGYLALGSIQIKEWIMHLIPWEWNTNW